MDPDQQYACQHVLTFLTAATTGHEMDELFGVFSHLRGLELWSESTCPTLDNETLSR